MGGSPSCSQLEPDWELVTGTQSAPAGPAISQEKSVQAAAMLKPFLKQWNLISTTLDLGHLYDGIISVH